MLSLGRAPAIARGGHARGGGHGRPSGRAPDAAADRMTLAVVGARAQREVSPPRDPSRMNDDLRITPSHAATRTEEASAEAELAPLAGDDRLASFYAGCPVALFTTTPEGR